MRKAQDAYGIGLHKNGVKLEFDTQDGCSWSETDEQRGRVGNRSIRRCRFH